MAAEVPFCRDCRYFTGGLARVYCDHPSNGRDPVTGRVNLEYAPHARSGKGDCGPDGKMFTPWPAPKTFWQWLFGKSP